MANYDQFAAAVNELSAGKNVVLLDDLGLPSVYVPINKQKNSELFTGGTEQIHPAFLVDSGSGVVEKTCFYYSKYENVIINDRAYSLAHRDPKTLVDFDKARKACEAKGKGFHLGTLAEWAAIELLAAKTNRAYGNTNYGVDEQNGHGQESSFEGTEGLRKTNRTFTGSGPNTWFHDNTPFGIADLVGNVWEWLAGMRLKDGEIQVIEYNNAALGSDCDMSTESALWKAINKNGIFVEPGESETLKYKWDGTKIMLTPGETTVETTGRYCKFTAISTETSRDMLEPPNLAKELALVPATANPTCGGRWTTTSGERLPVAGGCWINGSAAGCFALSLNNLRSNTYGLLGFRSAYVEL